MDQILQINCVIIGTVSAGKTTLLNSLFVEQYSDMKMKRTTMIPQVYHESDKINQFTNPDDINRKNSEINTKILSKTEKNEELTLDDITELEYYVPRVFDLVDLKDNVYLSIYDTPGLNDSKTKDVYFKYIGNNFHKFDIVIFMIDINSSMNTSDEFDILNLILNNIKSNKEAYNRLQKLLIIVNKCDEMFIDDDNNIILDADYQEMYDQAKNIISGQINKIIPDLVYEIIPMSCEDTYIYRMYSKNHNVALDIKYINKFGYNEYGKTRWNRLTDTEKRKKIVDLLKNHDYNDRMLLSGFQKFSLILKNWLSLANQYRLLCNHILYELSIIKHPETIDINNDIQQFHCIHEKISRLIKLYKIKEPESISIEYSKYIGDYFNKYYSNVVEKSLNSTADSDIINCENIKENYEELQKLIPTEYKYENVIGKINDKLNNYYKSKINAGTKISDYLSYVNILIKNSYNDWKKFLEELFSNNNDLLEQNHSTVLSHLGNIKSKYHLTDEEEINLLYRYILNQYKKIYNDPRCIGKLITNGRQPNIRSSYIFWINEFWNNTDIGINNKFYNEMYNLNYCSKLICHNKICHGVVHNNINLEFIDLTIEPYFIELIENYKPDEQSKNKSKFITKVNKSTEPVNKLKWLQPLSEIQKQNLARIII